MASPSAELQKAVFDALFASVEVGAIVGDRIYDGAPAAATFPYVSFGPSDYFRDDMDCIDARGETIQIDCWDRSGGRLRPTRELVDAVAGAIHRADLSMADNALVTIDVEGVRVFRDPDGITGHGVVTCTSLIEERS